VNHLALHLQSPKSLSERESLLFGTRVVADMLTVGAFAYRSYRRLSRSRTSID